VLIAAVQDVNAVKDAWDWIGLAAGIAGSIAAAIAIWFSVLAQRDATQARREAAAERRRQFELEILRDLIEQVDGGILREAGDDPRRLKKYEHRISLLPAAELPFWRKLMTLDWQGEVSKLTGFDKPWHEAGAAVADSAKRQPDTEGPDLVAWQANHDRLAAELSEVARRFHETVSDRLLRELKGAVYGRVEAGTEYLSFCQRVRHWWRFSV